jgi:hypothetical protein
VLKNLCPRPFSVGSNLLEPTSFLIFEKYSYDQILVEQRKVEVLLKKPCLFWIVFPQKSGNGSGFLKKKKIRNLGRETCILRI